MSEYIFNASALGFGGVLIDGGIKTTIPSLASVALAPTGGEGSAVVENYNNRGISFTRAESRVFGTEVSPNIYTTYSDVYITNLSIFDKLKIALMSATISSTRNLTSSESSFDVRIAYRGIAVDGQEVIPVLDGDLCGVPTFDALQTMLSGNVDMYARRFGVTSDALVRAMGNPLNPITGTLVQNFQLSEGVTLAPNETAIDVPNVGRAHFAEFLFKPGRRRINLLRIKIGSGVPDMDNGRSNIALMDGSGPGGDLTGGSVEGNGSPPM
jgi:hypothetical protein